MLAYPVVAEREKRNYSGFVPGLPVCVATGATPAEFRREMASAIAFHTGMLRKSGEPVPPPPWTTSDAPSLSCEIFPLENNDPDGYEVRLLLDRYPMNWDSLFTWVDGELLSELEVRPSERRRFVSPSGATVIRDIGQIRVRAKVNGNGVREALDEVVFAKKGDASALGFRTLMGLRIPAPPKVHKLKAIRKSEAIPLSAAA